MDLRTLNTHARTVAVWGVIGLGFALPLPAAWTSIMLLVILSGWAASGDWPGKWLAIKQTPAAITALIFFAIVVAGLLYGSGSHGGHYLTKYASLLILPLILSLGLDTAEKQRAIDAFCAAMAITLLLSVLVAMGVLPDGLFNGSTSDNPTVFKLHITHGFFMAIAAYFLVVRSQRFSEHRSKQLLLLFVAGLMIINALFMVQGRTGYAAVAVLLIYLFHLRFPCYGLLMGGLCAIVVMCLAYTASPNLRDRMDVALEQAQDWDPQRGDPTAASSIGTRLDYYSTTLSIIRQYPIAGVGTKGFPEAYERQTIGTALPPSNNPHNQYLLTTAQYGIIGLAALLGFYAACALQSRRQAPPFAQMAMGVLLAYLIGNLFNSFMLDFSERVFFAWSLGLLLSLPRSESTHPSAKI